MPPIDATIIINILMLNPCLACIISDFLASWTNFFTIFGVVGFSVGTE